MNGFIEIERECRSNIIDKVASEFEISKENVATVYDLLKVNDSAGWIFGDNLVDIVVDEFEKSPEKHLGEYLVNSLGMLAKKMVDDLVNKPEGIVDEIQKKIAPMSVEEAYKGKLNKIIDSIMGNKYDLALLGIGAELAPEKAEKSKRLILALVSKDNTYSGEEKERLKRLVSKYMDYMTGFINIDEQEDLAGDKLEEALRPYMKYIGSLIVSQSELQELIRANEWMANNITFETAVNIKKLCDEIKGRKKSDDADTMSEEPTGDEE